MDLDTGGGSQNHKSQQKYFYVPSRLVPTCLVVRYENLRNDSFSIGLTFRTIEEEKYERRKEIKRI